jgi:hypothetical protein
MDMLKEMNDIFSHYIPDSNVKTLKLHLQQCCEAGIAIKSFILSYDVWHVDVCFVVIK